MFANGRRLVVHVTDMAIRPSPPTIPGVTAAWPYPRSRDGGVDEIPLPVTNGRLWLCGKHVVGPDPQAVLEAFDATTIVCLTEAHELTDRYPAYVTWLRQHRDGCAVWLPIPD